MSDPSSLATLFAAPPPGTPASGIPSAVEGDDWSDLSDIGGAAPPRESAAVVEAPAFEFAASMPDARAIMVYAIVPENGTEAPVAPIPVRATWSEFYHLCLDAMPAPGDGPREFSVVPINSLNREVAGHKRVITITPNNPVLLRVRERRGRAAAAAAPPAATGNSEVYSHLAAELRALREQNGQLQIKLLEALEKRGQEKVDAANSMGMDITNAYSGILQQERESAAQRREVERAATSDAMLTMQQGLQSERDRMATALQLERDRAKNDLERERLRIAEERDRAERDRADRAAAERRDRDEREQRDRDERERRERADAERREREDRIESERLALRLSHEAAMNAAREEATRLQREALAAERERTREHLTLLTGLLERRAQVAGDPLGAFGPLLEKFGVPLTALLPKAWDMLEKFMAGGGQQTLGVAVLDVVKSLGERALDLAAQAQASEENEAEDEEEAEVEAPEKQPAPPPPRAPDRPLVAAAPPPPAPRALPSPAPAWGAPSPAAAPLPSSVGSGWGSAPAAPAAPAPAPPAPAPSGAPDHAQGAQALDDLAEKLESTPQADWIGVILAAMKARPELARYVTAVTLEGALQKTLLAPAKAREIILAVEATRMVEAKYLWLKP